MRKIVVENESAVIAQLTEEISKSAALALATSNVFRVGLSGGSVVNYLCTALQRIETDLTKWKFFFCDERYVPETDPESTFGVYKTKLLPTVQLKECQFFNINVNVPLEQCAAEYEQRILQDFQAAEGDIPQFDLLLLGMGPDGHTCSLFPGHKLLKEQKLLIAPISDSPKPPPSRITMTYPLINNAKKCVFAICGGSKAEIVKQIFVDKAALPAGMVAPKSGELVWILDEAAGKSIKS